MSSGIVDVASPRFEAKFCSQSSKYEIEVCAEKWEECTMYCTVLTELCCKVGQVSQQQMLDCWQDRGQSGSSERTKKVYARQR